MTARELSPRALNRAVLARQLLLRRVRLSPAAALQRVAGLQTQYAPSGYIGLWTRLSGFRRRSLTLALERRSVVQATLLRTTIHLVAAEDFWPFAAGLRHHRRAWWLRTAGRGLSEAELQSAASQLRAWLRAGPLRQAEISDLLARAGYDRAVWGGVGLWVELVRVPPSGTWEHRRADRYGLAEQWLAPGGAEVAQADGVRRLVRRYLGGFGPAAPGDIALWAGLPVTAVRAALDGMALRSFHDAAGRTLVDLPRAPLPDPATPAPVRFLGTWEALLLVHARRAGILDEEHRPLLFSTRSPQSSPSVLVDGRVAATWRYDSGRVTVDPFDAIPARWRRQVDEEAAALAAWHDQE